MLTVNDRIFISRQPTPQEDPDGVWLEDFEEIIGEHGTVIKDSCPYSQDSMYAHVEVDDYTDLFLPIPVLIKLES